MVNKVNFDLKAYLLKMREKVDNALNEYFPDVDGLTVEPKRWVGTGAVCCPWPVLWN